MEPLSLATAFATLVSLLSQFRSERVNREGSEYEQFLAWLSETGHAELKLLLERNREALDGLRTLIEEREDVLLERLDRLDAAFASYASGVPGFAEIAHAVRGQSALSRQAWSILQQVERASGSKFQVVRTYEGESLVLLDGRGTGQVSLPEPRFLEDDLRTLSELRLLRHTLNSQGDDVYLMTRKAAGLIRSGGDLGHVN